MEQEQDLVILGAGGPGKDTLGIVREINKRSSVEQRFDCIGFLDNDESKWGEEIHGIEVLGSVEIASDFDIDVQFVNTIGGASYFWKIPDIISNAGVADKRFTSIIHPDAYVSDSASISNGSVIYPGSQVFEDANIGKHVMIKGARIGHDQEVGHYARIEGGVCMVSNAKLGKCCYLGLNSTIREPVGNFAQIGMGSVVVNEVPDKEVFAGNPAEYIRDIYDTEGPHSE